MHLSCVRLRLHINFCRFIAIRSFLVSWSSVASTRATQQLNHKVRCVQLPQSHKVTPPEQHSVPCLSTTRATAQDANRCLPVGAGAATVLLLLLSIVAGMVFYLQHTINTITADWANSQNCPKLPDETAWISSVSGSASAKAAHTEAATSARTRRVGVGSILAHS